MDGDPGKEVPLTKELSYRDLVDDAAAMDRYRDYQRRYAERIRESDQKLIDMVRERAETDLRAGRRPALLDIGCSTGNFLRHLKRALPGLDLYGGDVVPSFVEECRRDFDLRGAHFEVMDMRDLGAVARFDLVIANASMMFLDDEEFAQATRSIATATRPGGWLLSFDYYHAFDQDVTIVERTHVNPGGLTFRLRSYRTAREALARAGFGDPAFTPFEIPVDLEGPDPEHFTSYTVRAADGRRLIFRGSLFQPWCYLAAQRHRA